MSEHIYDAIVVGSGMSGGWAAKELTQKGLKTLVLERGPMVKHGEYPTAMWNPWDIPYGGLLTVEDRKRQPVQTATFAGATDKHWFVDDIDHPYVQTQPFEWVRGYHVGGRSLMWGRQTYRWSEMDFAANANEGVAVDWPIRYKDLAPWYDHVETFIGVSGQAENLMQLPDGKFLPPMELNCVEKDFGNAIKSKFGRDLTIGRVAHLTAPLTHNESPQRSTCRYRNRCSRGCPFGAYFSSVASTLPAAEKTGNMTLLPSAIVYEIIYDGKRGRASGVRVLDVETGAQTEYFARVIFLCASAFGTAQLMLNSTSSRFPNGFGNDSDQLGRNVMDHIWGTGATGTVEGYEDKYYFGRRPNGFYIPRFRNLGKEKANYLRGYGYQGSASRQGALQAAGWGGAQGKFAAHPIGAKLKDAAAHPGPWGMFMMGFGEVLPHKDNRVTLDRERKDKFGLPVLAVDVNFRDNENRMRRAMIADAVEMLEAAGYKDVKPYDWGKPMGAGVHEMGTARMGRNAKTSVLNGWNQVHACKNVFVTDGACMTSAACQNPSLTYMALTARAANHAVEELKRRNL